MPAAPAARIPAGSTNSPTADGGGETCGRSSLHDHVGVDVEIIASCHHDQDQGAAEHQRRARPHARRHLLEMRARPSTARGTGRPGPTAGRAPAPRRPARPRAPPSATRSPTRRARRHQLEPQRAARDRPQPRAAHRQRHRIRGHRGDQPDRDAEQRRPDAVEALDGEHRADRPHQRAAEPEDGVGDGRGRHPSRPRRRRPHQRDRHQLRRPGSSPTATAATSSPNTGAMVSSGEVRAAPIRCWLRLRNVQPAGSG